MEKKESLSRKILNLTIFGAVLLFAAGLAIDALASGSAALKKMVS